MHVQGCLPLPRKSTENTPGHTARGLRACVVGRKRGVYARLFWEVLGGADVDAAVENVLDAVDSVCSGVLLTSFSREGLRGLVHSTRRSLECLQV